MLNEKMTLKQMLDFLPSKINLSNLKKDISIYLKLTIISLNKDDNYTFLKFFFQQELAQQTFYNFQKMPFFDFDARQIKKSHKFITICELFSIKNAEETARNIFTLLKNYHNKCDLVFDLYSLDNKHFRLSLMEGRKKLEEIRDCNEKEEKKA